MVDPQEGGGVGGGLRALIRIVHVWLVIARHAAGAGWDATAGRLRRSASLPKGQILPRRLRRTLADLGAGFVKVGQLLSTRADLLPDSYRAELASLADRARPVPAARIVRTVEQAVGPIEAAFASFAIDPVASASVSQVHEATLPDGRHVAVKVLRPGIAALVRADVALLALAAWLVERLWRSARLFDPSGTVAEVGLLLHQEVDLVAEAEHARAIRQLFADDPTVVVPEIVAALSGPALIVMDFIDGVSLADPTALEAAGYSPSLYAASVI